MKTIAPVNGRSIKVSNDVNDIIEINRRSATSTSPIRIIELNSLNDLIPADIAESIRRQLLANKARVMQLTNRRQLDGWTEVDDFVENCQQVSYVPKEVLPIFVETLIFDNIVALYTVEPEVSVTIIEDAGFAEQQRAIFDAFWQIATPTQLAADGSTTFSVTIRRSPREVYDYIANLDNWPQFSDFAANFEKKPSGDYIAHTPQGDITIHPIFNRKRLLLDHQCILPDGEVQIIPYRVVANGKDAELLMTNFCPRSSSRTDYDQQLAWMQTELLKAKEVLEA